MIELGLEDEGNDVWVCKGCGRWARFKKDIPHTETCNVKEEEEDGEQPEDNRTL